MNKIIKKIKELASSSIATPIKAAIEAEMMKVKIMMWAIVALVLSLAVGGVTLVGWLLYILIF